MNAVLPLTSENVHQVFSACLYTLPEMGAEGGYENPPPGAVLVEGLVSGVGFHPERLAANREAVKGFISQLNPHFLLKEGGGWSFLNLPFDKNERQWGEHRDAEHLFMLAVGLGMARTLMDRPMWKVFPGGMPYVVFSEEGWESK